MTTCKEDTMTIARIYKRGSIALLVMGSLASLAMPMSPKGQMGDSQDVRESVDGALDQIHGTAVGTINMPTLTGLGILTAVGQSEQGGVYMLDAELTSAIPGLFDHHNRVAFGGLYGELSQTPVGDAQDGQTGFDGIVEGTWRMDKALEGNYDALVYEREGDSVKLVGRITGVFRVNETPVSGPGVGDAVDNKKDFDTPFGAGPVIGDAVGSKKGFDTPYGEGPAFADGVDSKKAVDSPYMPPTSRDGAAVIGDGSLDAQHHAKNVELSGATKLQFKLLD
jgi:hypothetical protein